MKTILTEEEKEKVEVKVKIGCGYKEDTPFDFMMGNLVEESINQTEQAIIKKIEKEIDEVENPYPKDIFVWNNKAKLEFNRGRFNEFVYSVVETTKKDLKQSLFKEK